MQTFLPYSDFQNCAKVLDKKRCWKQVVEAKQILCVLRAQDLPETWKQSKDYINQKWKNHPAIKMWKGNEELLKHYYNIFLEYCKNEHKIKTKLIFLDCSYSKPGYVDNNILFLWDPPLNEDGSDTIEPFWLGNENFHRSHRARLIEKNRDFYISKFSDDEGFNNGRYFWPDMETKTFKII
jgi:hypothetical protein